MIKRGKKLSCSGCWSCSGAKMTHQSYPTQAENRITLSAPCFNLSSDVVAPGLPLQLRLSLKGLTTTCCLLMEKHLSFFFFFAFFFFLRPHLRHMEVLRLEVESKLQQSAYIPATAMLDLSCVFNLPHSSQQHQIL